MKLHVLDAIRKPCKEKFQELLLTGFSEVSFAKNEIWESYNLIPYSLNWARFLNLIDCRMKESIDSQLGVYTRKHSLKTIDALKEILESITEEDVVNHPDRFNTMFD